MRVLLAGATGVLGAAAIPRLLAGDHEVVALTRDRRAVAALERAGAVAAVADLLDLESLRQIVRDHPVDAVVHAAKAIPKRGPLTYGDMAGTNRLHEQGTRHLLTVAREAGVRRFVAASVVFAYGYGDLGREPTTEQRTTDITAELPRRVRPVHAALRSMERQVLDAQDGDHLAAAILRYGVFYGPGASDRLVTMLRRRAVPVLRYGDGLWPLIYIDDAADALVAAVTCHAAVASGATVVNVVDDEPVPPQTFLDAVAAAVRARPPLRLPRRLIAAAAPYYATVATTRIPASNTGAAAVLGWRPAHPTYRDGLMAWLGTPSPRWLNGESLSAADR